MQIPEQAIRAMDSQAPRSFDILPIEVNQHIASYIGSDVDLCSFKWVCRATRDAIEDDRGSFWRLRFLALFEKPSWTTSGNIKYRREYQKRRQILKYGAISANEYGRREFRSGTSLKEVKVLEVLRDLIVESFSEAKEIDDGTVYESVNLDHVLRFVEAHDVLRTVFWPVGKSMAQSGRTKNISGEVNPLMTTIRVLLAPMLLALDKANIEHVYSFPDSQWAVYATATQQPIFGGFHGLDVDMEWVLHQINFWRYHMIREYEQTLYNAYSALEEDERPRLWSSRLKQGCKTLGKHWKGSYAYVDRPVIAGIRAARGQSEDGQFQDEFNGELEVGAFQDMRLQFVDEQHKDWPSDIFADHLQARTPQINRMKTRAQHRAATPDTISSFKPLSFRFEGEGHDNYEDFLSAGWLNALPPQHDIPGWQRMTMMKYFEDADTGKIDTDALWAYEGVVLPGGQIMLGRWWCPTDGTGDNMYSGPFVLWCVDGPRHNLDSEVESAEKVGSA